MAQEQKNARAYAKEIYINAKEAGLVASWTHERLALFLLVRLLPQLNRQSVKACVVAGVNAKNLSSPQRTAVTLFTEERILICGFDGFILRKRLIPWNQVKSVEACSVGSFDSVYFESGAKSFQICADDKEVYRSLLSFLSSFGPSKSLFRGHDVFVYKPPKESEESEHSSCFSKQG